MNPSSFEYFSPKTIDEAIGLLSKFQDETKILAGGQSLIPLLKSRFASIPNIVDITQIKEMSYIKESDSEIRIGSLTTISEIEESELLDGKLSLIKEAAKQVADPLIRNRGTIGGNVSHGDPANDFPSVMLALNAEFEVIGPNGCRVIEAKDFFVDTFETSLEADEILKEIRIKKPHGGEGSTYLKLKKGAGDFSVAGVAVHLTVNGELEINEIGIGLTSVAPTAVKAEDAEKFLLGKKPEKAVLEEASDLAVGAASPTSDFYGSAEYKNKVLKILVKDAIMKSYEMAVGD